MMLSPPPFAVRTAGVVVCDLPVPLMATVTVGALLAFVTITRFAAKAPTAVGANVTLIEHVALGASEAGQALTRVKAAFVELTLVKVRFAVPVLRTDTACAGLVEPTITSPNDRLAGLTEMVALALPAATSTTTGLGCQGEPADDHGDGQENCCDALSRGCERTVIFGSHGVIP